jgi:serine/threonine protein kinase/Flp pilus assembly protein TadD
MTEQPKAVEAIFLSALDREPGERLAYVEGACAGNPDLLRRVRQLLDAHDESQGLLDAPPPGVGGTVDLLQSGEGPGAVIGPYKLLQQIGEGGMGTVFMAEQTQPLQRKVALKVIKAGMDRAQVLARFEAERQALALMDHPNIAKVLDADATPGGQPYFIMELVKGVPITRYCDERRLTPRQRLELFVPVCQAVQHAHQKGIIHRDLKPSNVLVALYDGQPVPKVIDFGVAKATGPKLTERTLFTEFGQVVGTLEYMSPEQAELNQLDIDTRSDVYSLGVLLYELLTGSTPLERKRLKETPLLEVLRVIREEEPPTPSNRLSTMAELPAIAANRGLEAKQLSGLVRGELDWIVMKALEKDRNRRYETANGFARDVQRYLHDEPVQACPPSAGYRLRKYVRRNRRLLGLLAILAVALLTALGAVAGSIGWVMRDQEARQAKLDGDFVVALERAELLHEKARRIEALAAWERAEVLGREATPNPALWARLTDLKARLDAEGQDEVFQRRMEEIRLQDQTVVDPERNLFNTQNAFPSICAAFRQYGIEVGVTPHPEVLARIQGRPRAVQAQLVVALDECLYSAPRTAVADKKWLLAVLNVVDSDPWRVIVRKAARDQDLQTLVRLAREVDVTRQPPSFLAPMVRRLSRKDPVGLDLARRVQRAYPGDFWANHHLGESLWANGLPAEAVCYHTAALALRPNNAGVYLNLALAHRDVKALDEALADLDQAIKLAPNYAMAWWVRGVILTRKGDLRAALDSVTRAAALNPNDGRIHFSLARILMDQSKVTEAVAEYREAIRLGREDAEVHAYLGYALHKQGKLPAAEAAYNKAIRLQPGLAYAHYGLGVLLCDDKHDYAGAAAAFRETCRLTPDDAKAHSNLGIALRHLGRFKEAEAELRQAIRLKGDLANAHQVLGVVLANQKRYRESIDELRAAIRIEPDRVWAHYNLGKVLGLTGDWGSAVAAYEKALRLGPNFLQGHINLATVLTTCPDAKLRNAQRALEAARQAVALAAKADREMQLKAWQVLGYARYRVGDWKESIEAMAKAVALNKASPDGTAWQGFFLAMAHWQLGHHDEARRWYDRALRWLKQHTPVNERLRHLRGEAGALLKIVEG